MIHFYRVRKKVIRNSKDKWFAYCELILLPTQRTFMHERAVINIHGCIMKV